MRRARSTRIGRRSPTPASLVPCGSLQFENGFQATGNAGQRTCDLTETCVRLGVANKTELRFGVPDYFHNADTGSGFTNGFGDFTVGLKQQLGPTHGFDVSLIPSASLPTGSTRTLLKTRRIAVR